MVKLVGQERKRIRAPWWAEEEWVEIRKLSFLDRRTIAGRSTTYGPVREDGSRQVFVDMAEMDLALMEVGIAAWNLLDEKEKPIKLRTSVMKQLDEPDGTFIVNAIHDFNPRRSAEEQEGFRAADGDGAASGEGAG